MFSFMELCAAMLILPFLLGYAHMRMRHKLWQRDLIYYRYFVCFNVIFASLVVAGRVFLESQQVPDIEGTIYDFYAIAVLSMMITALFTLFARHQLMFAAAANWIAFVVLSTLMHLVLIGMQEDGDVGLAWVHVMYNLCVITILSVLMWRLRKTMRANLDAPRAYPQCS